MTLPRIGISGRVATVEGAERSGVNAAYLRSVTAGGGAPVILSPLGGVEAVPSLLAGVEALILSGGPDIGPWHYGAIPHPKLGPIEPERDAFEFALFAEARARRIPTLAICRGMQLANVAMGGTLWQDLPSETGVHPQSGPRTERVHEVHVLEGSQIGDLLHGQTIRVNSFHHQAIRDLGTDVVSIVWTDDDVIEGIEIRGDWWFLGVQWHPEEFWGDPEAPDRGLFSGLVARARASGT